MGPSEHFGQRMHGSMYANRSCRRPAVQRPILVDYVDTMVPCIWSYMTTSHVDAYVEDQPRSPPDL